MPVAEAVAERTPRGSARPPGPPRRPEEPTARRRAGHGAAGDLGLTAGVAVATIAAVLPIGRLIEPEWLPGAILTVALVLLTGYALRRVGLPGVLSAAGELLMWIFCATVAYGHPDAFAGIVPTVDVVRDLPDTLADVGAELLVGVAPMRPSAGLAFVLIAAAGLLAFCVGHIVRSTRLPLLAAIALIAVFAIPQLAVPGDDDLMPAILLAAAILWLVRIEIRSRRPAMESGPVASIWAVLLGVGSVVAAVVFAPAVPLSSPTGGGVGRTSTISATLDLGEDLRRPADVEVLQLRVDTGGAPYLRVATLTEFDGGTWLPDDAEPGRLEFDEVATSAEVEERTVSIDVTQLSSGYLPVPYPAVEVTGVVGSWGTDAYNRTVSSETTTSLGQSYRVRSLVPQPTLEQAQASVPRAPDSAGGDFWGDELSGPELSAETLSLPTEAGGSIRTLAQEVTAGTDNAYDAMVALQRWFRSDGGFEYSLEAPVDEGFDGSGLDAILRFLDVRSGYCVHYASTFAVMARTLGIPARVVVGYLPGQSTGETVDDQSVYSVLGSQLHAWPEVHLDGIGWIPFEPTVSLGTPTSLRSEAAPGTDPDEPDAQASAAPTPSQSAAPEVDRGDIDNPDGAATAFDPAALLRGIGIALAAIVLLALPATVRAVRHAMRLTAARRGDAGAAWRELQDIAIDAGLTVDESDSPRVLAERLARDRGVPSAALAPLVSGIEHASFAPAGRADVTAGAELARALARVRAALLPAGRARLRASLLPRSLVVRPRVQGH
ncbi:transglutaminaseTgpA domain-containing protein [Microbacterium marinilacus]|uniref:DUF3488 and transglutaminase-like domain-containing protein n=1 Tax=Microbacterium marinilacus TaxID=415209 RepID=A0ABP7BEI5_9MICO|nr:DUF3488 and transglutaminase-like domain-containing protein [Microbacterium marinilacus]MBY0689307.1 DUF3488 and transglutaminase-like domain-containing protein [Microbacterium marinilacus]